MIKPVKRIPIGPILLIGFGMILIIVVLIWQILLIRPNLSSPRPQSGPAPTLAIPNSNSGNISRANLKGKVWKMDGVDYSNKYLDFSSTHL